MNSLQNSFKALLLLFVLVAGSCKHEPPAEPVDCGEATSIEEMMEWTYFKTGTYWIYREINTGVLDTCNVYYDYNGVDELNYQQFLYKIRSSHDGYTYEYWYNEGWSGFGSITPNCFIRVVDCDKYIPGDVAGNSHVFAFPLFIGNQCSQIGGGHYGASRTVDHLSVDSVAGLLFNDVYVFNQDLSPQHGYKPSTYKLCKGIGILSKEIPFLNEKWELIEYRIYQ
jgi:hypothetical protein